MLGADDDESQGQPQPGKQPEDGGHHALAQDDRPAGGHKLEESRSQDDKLRDDEFVERMAARARRVSSEVPRWQRASISLAKYERDAADRDDAIRAAYASGAYTLKAIGEHFGLHYYGKPHCTVRDALKQDLTLCFCRVEDLTSYCS